MTLASMTPAPESPNDAYVVVTAWHCHACDVQGRSPADAELACWNCAGQVIVTARPVLRLDEA